MKVTMDFSPSVCYICLEPLDDGPVDMDHVVPKSYGGIDGPKLPTHPRCNRSRGNRPFIGQSGVIKWTDIVRLQRDLLRGVPVNNAINKFAQSAGFL